jgi:mannan endo-1,4-beta-mannosidase
MRPSPRAAPLAGRERRVQKMPGNGLVRFGLVVVLALLSVGVATAQVGALPRAVASSGGVAIASADVASGATSVPLGRHVAFGAFVGGLPGSGSQVSKFETSLGARLGVASSFRGWGDVFPDAAQRRDADSGHRLLIAWDLGSSGATRFSTFTSGAHDGYLARVAASAANFGRPLYVRPWPELNADWVPFQPTAGADRPAGGTPAQFIAAWRYVVTFFRVHGAGNVRWVFNPTADVYPETTAVSAIWPGSAYVDVLGLDGYNWGTGGIFTWRTFADIFASQYRRLAALAPSLPVWVCEFGSKEPGHADGAPVDAQHSKAQWYRDLLSSTSFPKVSALVMFEVEKERDWRVSSDPVARQLVGDAVRATAG